MLVLLSSYSLLYANNLDNGTYLNQTEPLRSKSLQSLNLQSDLNKEINITTDGVFTSNKDEKKVLLNFLSTHNMNGKRSFVEKEKRQISNLGRCSPCGPVVCYFYNPNC
ncbi:unnamed protein product [Brachionus calyciflorus]|uniref:Uncharacterized protein n=1 Tax=Brachionus calyciflorus TaxID=104777 RepID=A0A814EJG0_9BILA|nr:unnamed protein product [Brachionus calyciflorus]